MANAKGGWKGSLASILKQHNGSKVDGSVASYATQYKRSSVLFSSFKELRTLGYKIDSVTQFKGKHFDALVRSWSARGLSSSTIQNRISVFRVFCKWVGKDGMIQRYEKQIRESGISRRSMVADNDRSWSAAGVDVQKKIGEVSAQDKRVGIQLELQRAFGLRARESMQLRPHQADKGHYLAVSHGTKGGRDRVVEIGNKYQRDVLDRAKALASKNGSTIDPKKNLSQWKNHYYRVIRSHGITRDSGFTSHGLRHERLNEVYKEVTGNLSPVQGGGKVDREIDNFARQEVAEVAGHSRSSISSAYLGSGRR
ncbi:integrase domain-containing protein (plasmid) [Tistrella bauzanensis]|nr:integrase domain-containing protein [Tistrella bauzanensis]